MGPRSLKDWNECSKQNNNSEIFLNFEKDVSERVGNRQKRYNVFFGTQIIKLNINYYGEFDPGSG